MPSTEKTRTLRTGFVSLIASLWGGAGDEDVEVGAAIFTYEYDAVGFHICKELFGEPGDFVRT